MLGVVFLTLALVAGQVSMHPSAFTLDDNGDQIYTGKMDENKGQLYTGRMPSERENLKYVAAGELYQSDILLTEKQWADLRARKGLDNLSQRWTEDAEGYPLVPYVFLDDLEQSITKEAIDHWMDNTCIKFEETSNTDQPHLQFFHGVAGECWSYVGMIYTWNGQKVSIGDGCNDFSVIVHEVGHAMGFWHEQSRSDRDDYVIILLENVESDYHGAFDKHADNNYSVPYDYSSNMHYGTYYFTSNDKPTMVTIDPMAQELIGSRQGLTHRDKLLANRMYGCIEKWLENCPGISSDPCLNDGYIQENCTCACPPGTSGTNCETVTGDSYYANLLNPRSEKITTEMTITVKTPMDTYETFVKWIVPPTCKSAKVVFTSGNMHSSCDHQYLNVRTDPTDYTGEKICAADVSGGRIFTSETGIIIIMTNRVSGYTYETTLWEAVVTFEDIAGCSGPDTTTQPPTTTPANPTTTAPTNPPTTTVTQPPTTTPANPTATAPTNPPTTTVNLLSTTQAPPPKLGCVKKPRKKTLSKGHAFTLTSPGYPNPYSKNKIKCGWKLKAKWPAKLDLTCQTFDLHRRDSLKVNRNFFKFDSGPSSKISKWLGITFFSRKRAIGPGFTCTVTAI